jgi:hypothetical protein
MHKYFIKATQNKTYKEKTHIDAMDSILGFFLFTSLTNILTYIPWTAIFLVTRFFGIHLYILKKKEECQRIQKKLTGCCSHIADDGRGFGYSVGRWFISHISITSGNGYPDQYDVWIVATKKSYEALTSDTVTVTTDYISLPSKEVPHTDFFIATRFGSFFNVYYKVRPISMDVIPIGEQKTIIDDIVTEYNKKKHMVVLLHGCVGSGKSMLAILLAKELKGVYSNTSKFWEPGDSISNLVYEIEPTEERPLIISFDEVDNTIHMIHNGIERHKSLTIQIQNKPQWNTFLDEVDRGLYQHVIIIMTTNKTPQQISEESDASYLRKGRINMIREMNVCL